MIDLTQYEDAATLNRWFLNNYPLGRIDLQLVEINLDKGIVVFKGSLYRDSNDANPAVTNYAKGERDDYPAHMRKWYLEDTATSCIARCLTLLKGSNKTAPKESMARATSWSVEPKAALLDDLQSADRHAAEVFAEAVRNAPDTVMREVGTLPEQVCEDGSRMRFKEGISKTTGKPFKGYVCECGKSCPAKWASQSSNGNWYFKESVNG
jgi:hypothetical protein